MKEEEKTENWGEEPESLDLPFEAGNIGRIQLVKPREKIVFSYSGLLFMLASVLAIAVLVYILFQMQFHPPDVKIEKTVDYFIDMYFGPSLIFASAFLLAVVGFFLLKAAGTSSKEIIPAQDFNLISMILTENKDKGIDEYIRLSSLSGYTGFFTKIGLTGLPLATIGLTLIFTIMSVFGNQFFDLAKLTLGAFLGSYVQRQVGNSSK